MATDTAPTIRAWRKNSDGSMTLEASDGTTVTMGWDPDWPDPAVGLPIRGLASARPDLSGLSRVDPRTLVPPDSEEGRLLEAQAEPESMSAFVWRSVSALGAWLAGRKS